jgi:hypothetical protein
VAVGQGGDVPATEVYRLLMGIGFDRKPNKLVVRDARIVGVLDLESANIDITAEFQNCTFRDEIKLEQANAKGLYFVRCNLNGMAASQLRTTFSFVLRDCHDTGGIKLAGAHVSGQVRITETTLQPSSGPALTADGLVVDQDMICDNRFRAIGCVRLVGAHVGGQLQCTNAEFVSPGKDALQASGLEVAEHVWWSQGCRVDGAIKLRGAHIEGDLHCEGGEFDNGGGVALDFSGLRVDQDVTFTAGADVTGAIDLTGCHIGGMLDLTGGRVRYSGTTPALDLARAVIDQNMVCRSGCDIQGKVLLAGAKISGNLWCGGARFHNVNNIAVDATGMSVGRDAEFSGEPGGGGFLAEGQLVLSDAQIGGSLKCGGGMFDNDGGIAIVAKGLNVTRDARFGAGFVAHGEVDLADATIGGYLNCTGGRFQHRPTSLSCDRIKVTQSAVFGDGFYADGTLSLNDAKITVDVEFAKASLGVCKQGVALDMHGADVGGTLRVRFDPAPDGEIDLSQATVGRLDDEGASWPAKLRLEGFQYGGIPADHRSVRERLAWLRRNPGYLPQIYLQLASVYHEAGSDDDSTTVAIAGEDARRRAQRGVLGMFRRLLGLALKYTVQYGYRPLRVLWWVIGLEISGSILFWQFHDHSIIKPTDGAHADFNPILYTLDLLVPVISLGQKDSWYPVGVAVPVAAVFTITGWILATCLAIGVGKIFNSSSSS